MYLVGAAADKARAIVVINPLEDADRVAGPRRGGLRRIVTMEVTPEEVGPNSVNLDEEARTRLVPRAAVEEQLPWLGISPTDEEEERIAHAETVTFLVNA